MQLQKEKKKSIEELPSPLAYAIVWAGYEWLVSGEIEALFALPKVKLQQKLSCKRH